MANRNKRETTPRQRKKETKEAPRVFSQSEKSVIRLNRFIARAGITSRRGADTLIEAGRVKVDGDMVTRLGTKISPDAFVEVDGHPVRPVHLVTYLLNKPRGTITTKDDEHDRETVLDLLHLSPEEEGAIFPVGRLDRETTGALLLTTDGDLAHRLMHPRYEIEKIYLVKTERPVSSAEVDKLTAGLSLDDGPARADHAQLVSGENQVALQIHEGRNRQVRRMFEALGHTVVALDRIQYAGLTLEGLDRGEWRKLKPHEVNALRRSVTLKLIKF